MFMYTNPYINQNYISELQSMKDRIDRQLQQVTQPQQQTPNIQQTFQLAPTQNQTAMRYVNTIDDVNKELVFGDTPFFAKDLSVMWLKNVKGEVKSYELNEIVQKDEKDLMIESLQLQIDELKKGMINNAKSIDTDTNGSVESTKSTRISSSKSSNAREK